jgi:hypothetical protein
MQAQIPGANRLQDAGVTTGNQWEISHWRLSVCIGFSFRSRDDNIGGTLKKKVGQAGQPADHLHR